MKSDDDFFDLINSYFIKKCGVCSKNNQNLIFNNFIFEYHFSNFYYRIIRDRGDIFLEICSEFGSWVDVCMFSKKIGLNPPICVVKNRDDLEAYIDFLEKNWSYISRKIRE